MNDCDSTVAAPAAARECTVLQSRDRNAFRGALSGNSKVEGIFAKVGIAWKQGENTRRSMKSYHSSLGIGSQSLRSVPPVAVSFANSPEPSIGNEAQHRPSRRRTTSACFSPIRCKRCGHCVNATDGKAKMYLGRWGEFYFCSDKCVLAFDAALGG